MTRTPRKMRRREREALERLWTQLMHDLAAVRAPPMEWTLRSTRGPLRVSLWSELPAVKCRSPAGARWTRSWTIGPHLPIFVDLVTWLCGVLKNPEPAAKKQKPNPDESRKPALIPCVPNNEAKERKRMYVIMRQDGQYVTPSGCESSYTRYLQSARMFATREAAQAETCVDNERVVSVREIVTPNYDENRLRFS